jgi:hypothetical protein
MRTLVPVLVLALAAPTATLAQKTASAAATAPATAPAASAPSGDRRVLEDDNVRIEETRLRGQTRQITVQPKGADGKPSGRPYEILTAPGGRDAAQERGAAGQRAWSLVRF